MPNFGNFFFITCKLILFFSFFRYVTTVIMFWVNSRCVSYCLDNAWGDVIEDETSSKTWQFLEMATFCFYVPLCISGPLISYKDYKEGVSNETEIHFWILTIKKYNFRCMANQKTGLLNELYNTLSSYSDTYFGISSLSWSCITSTFPPSDTKWI